jgi:raffinose/stachyose/melibiose transport system permease protein
MTVTQPPAVPPGTVREGAAGGDRAPLEHQQRKLYWPFLAPALLLYLAFLIGPSLAGLWVSFNAWRGVGDDARWVGLAQYRRLLNDPIFHRAFWNTLTITVLCGIGIFIIAFAMTMLLREMWGRKVLRSLLFFPYIISPIVIAIGLGLLLAPQGALNQALQGMGLDMMARPWLNPQYLFRVILVGIVWVSTGFYVVILMAGIDQIPRYFYEDSELGGATMWQTFRNVTLPLNWDVVTVASVLWVINSIRIFEFIIAFSGTANAPPAGAQNIPLYQFFQTTGGRMPPYNLGYGAAMGVVMVVLVAILIVLLRRLMRRDAVQF